MKSRLSSAQAYVPRMKAHLFAEFKFFHIIVENDYSPFDIFRKVVFCQALYTGEVNCKFLAWINAKLYVVSTYAQKVLF